MDRFVVLLNLALGIVLALHLAGAFGAPSPPPLPPPAPTPAPAVTPSPASSPVPTPTPSPAPTTTSALDYYPTKPGHYVTYKMSDGYNDLQDCKVEVVFQYSGEGIFFTTLTKIGVPGGYFRESAMIGGEHDGRLLYWAGCPVGNQANFWMLFTLPVTFEDGDTWRTNSTDYRVSWVDGRQVGPRTYEDCIKIEIDNVRSTETWLKGEGEVYLSKGIGIIECVFRRSNGEVFTAEILESGELPARTISGRLALDGESSAKGYVVALGNYWHEGLNGTTVDSQGRFALEVFGHSIILRYGPRLSEKTLDVQKSRVHKIQNITGDISGLTVKEKPVTEGVELKYDDGTAEASLSSGPGGGYLISFSPPAIPFTVNKVKICGVILGTGWEGKQLDVQIWDKKQEVLHSASYPFNQFPTAATPQQWPMAISWTEIEVPNIEVKNDFYVHVYTGTGKLSGIHLGADNSVVNEHSDMTTRKADGTFRILAAWPYQSDSWFGDKSKVNWMIRVVGNTITNATPIPESSPEEIELKVSAHSSHFSSGYYVQLMVDDPNQTIRSVDVTGPGIVGFISLTPGIAPDQWWSQPNVNFEMSPPALPLVYTFTITDEAGNRYVFKDEVLSYVNNFATNLTPTGGQTVTDKLVLTWIGINMPDVRYMVQLNDEQGNRIWDSPPTTATSLVYDGPILVPGNYQYYVSAISQYGDESLASATFKVVPP